MNRISTSDLKTGMVIGQNVYSPKGQLILSANTILTRQMLSRLIFYKIPDVYIVEGDLPDQAKVAVALKKNVEQTYTQRILNSDEYKRFQKRYSTQVDFLKGSLNDLVLRNVPIDEDAILTQTMSLFADNPTTFSLLGMMHSMKQIDDSTYAHSVNVSLISRLLGNWMHFSEKELATLTLAGLLHDAGKCKVPDTILLKPGKLTKEEFSVIKKHPLWGYEALKDQEIDSCIKKVALLHHERSDGSGYPFGIKNSDIDKYTAIVSIADVYDAMTANRCYRNALCPFDVISMFEEEGICKYKAEYILTFLEHIANTYVNCDVLLSDNSMARIILLTENLTRPVVQLANNKFIDLNDHPELYIQATI